MLMATLFVSEKLERTHISTHKSINGAIFVQRNATEQQKGMKYLHTLRLGWIWTWFYWVKEAKKYIL